MIHLQHPTYPTPIRIGASADASERLLRELAPLVHRMSNQLQRAVGEADLLAESARARGLPPDVRRDIASLLDQLDAVVTVVQHVQLALRDATGGGNER